MAAWECAECTARYAVGLPECPQCGSSIRVNDVTAQDGATVTVRCCGPECPAYGIPRTVPLRLAAPGVIERPPLHCAECDLTLETVTNESEEEQDMPKITRLGGPSIDGFDVNPDNGELTPADEGGEDVSAGSNSSTSSEKDSSSQPTSEQPDPSPAPTTASRSAKARTGKGSTARPTAGDPADGTSATGSADA